MRTGYFVEGLSNMEKLFAAVKGSEDRGAPEAGWVLAEGEPGYGKTRGIFKIGFLKGGVIVRAKATWTPRACLIDLADQLGVARSHRTQELLSSVISELMQRPRMLVIDEIDHAARDVRVLETLRDITDTCECVLLAGGMKGARGLIKRYPQIYSRIAEIVTFGPATVRDVKTICAQLTDVEIGDDLAEEIQKRTGGRLREVMNAVARVEAFGKKMRGKVTLEAYGPRPLINEDRARSLPVAANG